MGKIRVFMPVQKGFAAGLFHMNQETKRYNVQHSQNESFSMNLSNHLERFSVFNHLFNYYMESLQGIFSIKMIILQKYHDELLTRPILKYLNINVLICKSEYMYYINHNPSFQGFPPSICIPSNTCIPSKLAVLFPDQVQESSLRHFLRT